MPSLSTGPGAIPASFSLLPEGLRSALDLNSAVPGGNAGDPGGAPFSEAMREIASGAASGVVRGAPSTPNPNQAGLLNIAGFDPREYAVTGPGAQDRHTGWTNGRPPTSLPGDVSERVPNPDNPDGGPHFVRFNPTDDSKVSAFTGDQFGYVDVTGSRSDGPSARLRVSQSNRADGPTFSGNIRQEGNIPGGEAFINLSGATGEQNWSWISGGVEFPINPNTVGGLTAGTNLNSDTIRTNLYLEQQIDDDWKLRVGLNTSSDTFLGGDPTVTGQVNGPGFSLFGSQQLGGDGETRFGVRGQISF